MAMAVLTDSCSTSDLNSWSTSAATEGLTIGGTLLNWARRTMSGLNPTSAALLIATDIQNANLFLNGQRITATADGPTVYITSYQDPDLKHPTKLDIGGVWLDDPTRWTRLLGPFMPVYLGIRVNAVIAGIKLGIGR